MRRRLQAHPCSGRGGCGRALGGRWAGRGGLSWRQGGRAEEGNVVPALSPSCPQPQDPQEGNGWVGGLEGGWQRGLEAPRLGHRMTRSAQHLARAEGGGRAYKGPGGWVRAESPRGWEGQQRQRRWEPWRAREQGSSKSAASSGGAGRRVLEWGWVETAGQRGDRTQPVRTGSRMRESWQQQEREGV